MAGESAVLNVVLQDGASGPAAQAASGLANLKTKIEADTAALRNMQAAMAQLKGGTSMNIESFKSLNQQIVAQKAKIADSTNKLVGMNGAFDKVAGPIKAVEKAVGGGGDAIKGMMDSAKAATGPMGGLFEKVNLLKEGLGKGGVYGAAVLAAVVVLALCAAVVIAIAKMAEFALACSDAARSQNLLLQGLTGSAKAAGDLQGVIGKVSANVAIGSDKVQDYAEQLYKAGLRGSELESALEAASIKSSVMGESAASDFIKVAKAAKDAGGDINKLSSDVKGKLGGIAKAQMLSLSVQTMKLKENFAKIFSGVKIEPFLKALQEILSVFDSTTASGKALKAIVEVMLNPLFGATGSLGPIVKKFFQGMVIAALILTIAIVKLSKAFKDMLPEGALSGIDMLTVALYAGMAAVAVLAAVLLVLTVILGVVAVAMFLAFLPSLIVIAVIIAAVLTAVAIFYLLYSAVMAIVDAVSAVWDAFSALDLTSIGSNLMQGLANGITAGVGWVMSAITSLAGSMKGAIMGALGIGSPSKVFAGYGLNVTQGMTQGVEKGAPQVDAAVGDLAGGGSGGGGSPISMSASAMGGGKTSSTTNNKGITYINIKVDGGGKDGAGIGQAIRREIEAIFEGTAIEMGAPLEPETT